MALTIPKANKNLFKFEWYACNLAGGLLNGPKMEKTVKQRRKFNEDQEETLQIGRNRIPSKWDTNKRSGLQKEWEETARLWTTSEKNKLPTVGIHMGHALSKISKDFIVRSKSMKDSCHSFQDGIHTGQSNKLYISWKGWYRKSIAEFRMCGGYALRQWTANVLIQTFEVTGIGSASVRTEWLYLQRIAPHWSPSSESSLARSWNREYKEY